MIPKIIHYTWFSNDPFPEMVKECMESWREWMPDYEFKLWDMASINSIDSVFLKEAISERKWAFASDFVRLYAVYYFGGIYLDTDVLVFRNYDELLNERAFIGRENSIHFEAGITATYLTSHCFGAEKYHPFVGRCLHYYDDRHFRTSDDDTLPMSLKYDVKILPFIQAELARQIGYNSSLLVDGVQNCEQGLVIFPKYYFDCTNRKKAPVSFCKHLALGGWRDSRSADERITLKYKIKHRIVSFVRRLLNRFGYLMYEKK